MREKVCAVPIVGEPNAVEAEGGQHRCTEVTDVTSHRCDYFRSVPTAVIIAFTGEGLTSFLTFDYLVVLPVVQLQVESRSQ